MRADTPSGPVQLEWTTPDVEGLVQFLVTENGFSEDRIRKGAEKLKLRLQSKPQSRLDSFFTVKPKDPAELQKKRKVRSPPSSL